MNCGLLDEDRILIRDQAREFAMREVLPIANRLDPVKGDIPQDLREKMAEMGYFGITIPEEYGGLGLGVFEYCIVAEELSRAWMSVASLMARSSLPGIEYMSEPLREEFYPKLASGQWLGAFALSEPSAGSDLGAIGCRATRVDDGWVLHGNKYWCTFADQADFLIVFARTSPASDPKKKHQGITAFLVRKERGVFPKGISGQPIPKIGYFGWRTYELAFDQFHIPPDSVIGDVGAGFKVATHGLEKARAHTAARAIGLARGGLEDAILYAQEREQFGQPIGKFQSIRFKIAHMAAEIESARQLNYSVCNQIDGGGRCDLESSMSKYIASEMAERVTSEALQIHGGAGYTTLYAVERHWRDARLTKIFEGTSEIQLRIISDRLLGK